MAATVIVTHGGAVVLGIAAGIAVAVLAGSINGYFTVFARRHLVHRHAGRDARDLRRAWRS